LKDIKAAIKRT